MISVPPSTPIASHTNSLTQLPSASFTLPMPSGAGMPSTTATEVLGRHLPDFHVDGRAAFGHAHYAGPLHRATGECVELVFRFRLHRAEQARSALCELRADLRQRRSLFRVVLRVFGSRPQRRQVFDPLPVGSHAQPVVRILLADDLWKIWL